MQNSDQENIKRLRLSISKSLNTISDSIDKSNIEKQKCKKMFDELYNEVVNHITSLENSLDKDK